MENPLEDEIVRRWQATERAQLESNGDAGSRKRPRQAIENRTTSVPQLASIQARSVPKLRSRTTSARKSKGKSSTTSTSTSTSRVVELTDGEGDEVEAHIDLDSLWED
jgi:hypothetical protein